MLFDLEAAPTDLYAIPYPNDLRRRSDGTLELAHLERDQPELIARYLGQVKRDTYGGFGPNAGAFFRFTAPLLESSLPRSPEESLQPGSSLQLVNIEPGSPSFGRRLPIRWRFSERASRFIGARSLAVLPVAGFTMEPRARHAIILTSAVRDAAGISLGLPDDLRELLYTSEPSDPALAHAHQLYAPLREFLARERRYDVVGATVFTVGDPAALAGRARRVLQESAAPSARSVLAHREEPLFFELRGSYTAPNFQQGTPPYSNPADGGDIQLDGNGDPRPARDEELRFALTLPKGTMPPGGWPLVIYAHGTGGDYRSFIEEELPDQLSAPRDVDGSPLPGLAMIGIDQNVHGPRDPSHSMPELSFFNLQNPPATVCNVVQAGIDDFSLLRMMKQLSLAKVSWSESGTPREPLAFDPPLRFDPQRIYFMGHSQGGLTGPVFLAHEPEVRGAMLSGAGGGAAQALLEKTLPIAVRVLLELALAEQVDEFHPLLNLIQQMLEPADPLNYGRMLIHHRPAGFEPKHVFLSQGLVDHYTPNSTTDALAAAIGLPLAGPVLRPVEVLGLLQLAPRPLPVSGEIKVEGRAVTGALIQYRAESNGRACSTAKDCQDDHDYCDAGLCRPDGHFVIFRDPRAEQHLSRFFGTMVRDGVPTLGP